MMHRGSSPLSAQTVKRTPTPTPSRSTERGTVAAADADNDWLAGTAADPTKKGNESWLNKKKKST